MPSAGSDRSARPPARTPAGAAARSRNATSTRGTGTVLIRRLLRTAREAGIERVSLSVGRDNPAVGLYTREGFRLHGRDEGEDSLTMVVHLR
ncbi:GNAT family N-acetyltransferase [Streptomyces sp. BE20]|uniref:GNAT family N-acetyltransferase n=1 Tax=Streptomyces sp. BE20 TaxID=3002525 RepID=UPI002E7758FC|nr:GNAT family N-acetyltransferase [Streptomyces sp. BE20]MEE1827585.1 GNAT family N-acetyltransferase [Streptomyces sp. BE20]